MVGSVYDTPLPSTCVDLAVSQELLEHLELPQRMFDEVSRIPAVFYSDVFIIR